MRTLLHGLLATITLTLLSAGTCAANDPAPLKNDPKNPIRIYAIFHDDIPQAKRKSLYGTYIWPFTEEFERITGRKVNVIFDEHIAPYSSFDYKGDDQDEVAYKWAKLTREYRLKRETDREFKRSRHDRVMLITKDGINDRIKGVTVSQPGHSLIASIGLRQAIGHELGHSFNAGHSDGAVHYNGWWCETFMYPPFDLRASCLVFSEANRKRIKAYVDSLYDGSNGHEFPEQDSIPLD